MGDDHEQCGQPRSEADVPAPSRFPDSASEAGPLGSVRSPLGYGAVARADQRQRRAMIMAMQTRAGNRAVSRWAGARSARQLARTPKLDFYQNAFYANRYFAKDPSLPPGWPYEDGLRTLWDAATEARADESSGWTRSEFRAFADAVRRFQVDHMSLSQKDANGAIDARTARALNTAASPPPEAKKDEPVGDAIAKTIEWLRNSKRTAHDFFAWAWAASPIVLLGERHHDDVQLAFAADMVYRHGGASVALALEIDIDQQAAIDYYLANGRLPDGPRVWWGDKNAYKSIMDAAKSTQTRVVAMDNHSVADRDAHMASVVQNLALQVDKVFVLVGSTHIQEASAYDSPNPDVAQPARLGQKLGGTAYAIDMGEYKGARLPTAIKAAFPDDASIGFDVDDSPLRRHPDQIGIAPVTMGANLDGYIYLAQ